MADALDTAPSRTEPLLAGVFRFAMSAVGSKVLMALTGLGLGGFIVAHMAGNLAMWGGPAAMNNYAAALKANPPLLWGVRFALLAAIPLHFWAAVRSSRINAAARPVAYAHGNKVPASLGAKTMIYSGLVVLAFLLFHLAHFTLPIESMGRPLQATGAPDVFTMVFRAFESPVYVAIYVVCQLLLAQHLSHGFYSMFQHLGLWGIAWTPVLKRGGQILAWVVCLAFCSVPVGVLTGLIHY